MSNSYIFGPTDFDEVSGWERISGFDLCQYFQPLIFPCKYEVTLMSQHQEISLVGSLTGDKHLEVYRVLWLAEDYSVKPTY